MAEAFDVFHWKMSAAEHRSAVNQLRREIIQAHAQQRPLPISLIVQLLPLQSDQLGDAAARGDISFTGDAWANEAATELWIEFEDQVLQTFNVTIPRVWTGRVAVDGERLTIFFDSVVELEIPRLAELGVGRSSFQNAASIYFDPDIWLTVLREVGQTGRDTWIEARLVQNLKRELIVPREVTRYAAFASEDPCPKDPNERNWYVYRRTSGGLCVVHYGTIIEGGQLAWENVFGPGTKAAADAYEKEHCNCGPC